METRVFESKFNVLKVPKPLTKEQMIRYKGGSGYDGYGDGGYGEKKNRECVFWCIDFFTEEYKAQGYILGGLCVPDAYNVCVKDGWMTLCNSGCYP